MPSRPHLRILHVATHTGIYRGGAVQMARMAIAQKRSGASVEVIVRADRHDTRSAQRRDLESWAPLLAAGVSVRALDYLRWWGRLRLGRLLNSGEFDIVHVHRDDALRAVHRMLKSGAAPALIAQRGTIRIPPDRVRPMFASPRLKAVVAVADAVRTSLASAVSETASKIHVVYGSVDLNEFRPRERNVEIRKNLGIPAGATVIGSLSAYRKAKGLESLVNALGRVMKRHEDMHAILLGGGVEEPMAPIARELHIVDRIHFVGHQTDVARWISTMDLTVVAATDREGLSGVLRESLAMEVPVISTDCAGNGEIVRDRVTGLLVPQDDTVALTEALGWALQNPQEMKSMAAKGRLWVEKNCASEVQRSRLEEIYRSVI